MKKILACSLFLVCFIISGSLIALGYQTDFSKAVRTCENYSQTGSAEYEGEIFNILITLEKAKNGTCTYKEKIYQGKNYQMLTCHFNKENLPFIANSMEKFSETFKKELSKNKIFEAKLTTNGEVFQKYLANPKYCTISHSKQ